MTFTVIEGKFGEAPKTEAQKQDNAAAVAFLREALALAEQGLITQAVMVMVDEAGVVTRGFSGARHARTLSMLGGIESIKLMYINQMGILE